MPTKKTRRRGLTNLQIERLQRRVTRWTQMDPETRGHAVRVMPSGPHVFYAVTRDPKGRQVWTKIGAQGELTIEESRKKAAIYNTRVREGLPAIEEAPEPAGTLREVAADWLQRHIIKRKVRSVDEIRRRLDVYVLPELGNRTFAGLGRRDFIRLAEKISDERGDRQADMCLTDCRSIARWYAINRDENYRSPFVAGMRQQVDAKPRSRALTDAEVKQLWLAPDSAGLYRDFARVALATAQRRSVIAHMKWSDLEFHPDGSALWRVPMESSREKGNGGELILPPLVVDIIKAQPRLASNPHVFPASRGDPAAPVMGIASLKGRFDKVVPMAPFTTHDLRRTARSLLARTDTPRDICERILGHRVGTKIEQTYDQHPYVAEKRDGLARLAQLIKLIVEGRADNVVPLPRTKP
jgi:integrase